MMESPAPPRLMTDFWTKDAMILCRHFESARIMRAVFCAKWQNLSQTVFGAIEHRRHIRQSTVYKLFLPVLRSEGSLDSSQPLQFRR
jgi:hypothetical protein